MIIENASVKDFVSNRYNYHFNKKTGFFARWGVTEEDDPNYSPFGPELADIEISTVLNIGQYYNLSPKQLSRVLHTHRRCKGNCPFCYKGNNKGNITVNMTIDTFNRLLDILPRTITQIAFGICDIDSNPDMWKIFNATYKAGIIPNFTTNGIGVTPEVAQRIANVCGAVAVSIVNKEVSYTAIRNLLNAGVRQTNIHFMLSQETYEKAFSLIDDIVKARKEGDILGNVNAIVFLMFKNKGGELPFTPIVDTSAYKTLIDKASASGVNYGFDSCSAFTFLKAMGDSPDLAKLKMLAEPCESTKFSAYINTFGEFFPCSFLEGEEDWKEGIDVLSYNNFVRDVWNHPRTVEFRAKSIGCAMNEQCPCHYSL